MPQIVITTSINAPIERVFDLSRSIDLHMLSTKQTHEKAIAGVTSGLIGLHETVTWRAKHVGVYQKLSVKITAFDRPCFFVDEMLQGAFASMRHEHHFEAISPSQTLMRDVLVYQSPLGIFGRLADKLFLENYMRKFLQIRNQTIVEIAEGDGWKSLL